MALYAHAAQGLVWNAVLSRRIRDFGPKPVIGDLVFSDDSAKGSSAASADVADIDQIMDEEDNGGNDDTVLERSLPSVRRLNTDEDVSSAKLSDILLPLPGSEVEYPPHLLSVYESVAKEFLGLSLTDFHDSRLVELRGAYRQAVVRPSRLEWRVVEPEAANGNGPLMATDVANLLEARKAGGDEADSRIEPDAATTAQPANESQAETVETTAETMTTAAETSGDGNPAQAAVVFKCNLPPSAYLTMMLREISKRTTE